MNKYRNLLLMVFLLTLAACADFFKRDVVVRSAATNLPQKDLVKFSENPNVGAFNEKKYRRSTRKSLEEENEVHSRAGSLWNTEGQGAFLFSQNKARREGDLLNIKMEGAGKSQVETKIKIIKKLLARLEVPIAPIVNPDAKPGDEQRGLASVNPAGAAAGTATAASPAKPKEELKALSGAGSNGAATGNEEDQPSQVDAVPTRVVERLADGNYRVKGVQPFMIGKREYKVIVTGFVRPEDFSDEGVSSNKILDPQWDVVSLRRMQQ